MAWIGAGAAEAPPGCIFCTAWSSDDDRGQLVVRRSEHAFLILNAFPYASGHLMVAVKRHVPALTELGPEELTDTMLLVQRGVGMLDEEDRPHGYNIGINQGGAAGAGIAEHLHIHVVPRWRGDANFMTSVADVRVLPETLDRTWERLRGRVHG